MIRIIVKGNAYYSELVCYMNIFDYGTAWKLESTTNIGFRIVKLNKI